MVTDVKELIGQCEQELTSREYTQSRLKIITGTWRDLIEWMELHACGSFNEDIGFQYCNETFGSCVLSGIEKKIMCGYAQYECLFLIRKMAISNSEHRPCCTDFQVNPVTSLKNIWST